MAWTCLNNCFSQQNQEQQLQGKDLVLHLMQRQSDVTFPVLDNGQGSSMDSNLHSDLETMDYTLCQLLDL